MPMLGGLHNETSIPGKVIIVEDDDLMRTLVVDIFTEIGHSCVSFITADDALMHLLQSQERCTLLVTDYTLPGQLDGRELALMVRQRWPAVPVIVTTGFGSEVGNELPAGVAFLRKPWSVDALIEIAIALTSN